MLTNRAFPTSGLVLLAVAMIGLLIAGIDWWLVLAVSVIWAGSLWLSLPEPAPDAPKIDATSVSRDAVSEVIESLSQPLLLLNENRIVMANAAARSALGSHIINQDARIALRHPEAMRLLELDSGATVSIAGFTGARTLWELTRCRIDDRRWLIELADRTAEADVSRAHTDFVANASHELRTPLASVIGYLETLGDGGDKVDLETRQRFIAIAKREAERMLSLVEDLMSLSHVEAEKHDLPGERIDLRNMAERVVAEITTVRGKERVTVTGPIGELAVAGDPAQLEQLLRNLVDNALKYGEADHPVSVDVSEQPTGRIALTVKDYGAGIAPEHLPHLTRRFYRTEPGRSRASGGTGLGLAIVKHIVERHRADLQIESMVGAGTTVKVSFAPFADAVVRDVS